MARHEQFQQDIKGHVKALLEGLRSCGKRTTICKVPSVVCPDNSKASLKEMEAVVDTYKQHSDKIEATNTEVNLGAMEAILYWMAETP
jgi:hypothetical protein